MKSLFVATGPLVAGAWLAVAPAWAAPTALITAPSDSTAVPVYQDAGVEVTASRYAPDERLNVSNLTAADLARREPDQELPMLMQSLPGVFAYSDAGNGLGYTYLKVRGFDQRRVGVLLNGIPLNDPEDHQVWWVDLPDLAADVQDVQLQRGVTGSVGGMTAIGGTVDVVTTPPGRRPGHPRGGRRRQLRVQAADAGLGQRAHDGAGWAAFGHVPAPVAPGNGRVRDRSAHEGWAFTWSGRRETARTINQINIKTGRELSHHAWDAVPESVLRVDRTANVETYHNAVDDFRQPHFQWHHTWFLTPRLTLTTACTTCAATGSTRTTAQAKRPETTGWTGCRARRSTTRWT